MKRKIAAILAAAMVVGLLSTTTWAAEEEIETATDGPYQVELGKAYYTKDGSGAFYFPEMTVEGKDPLNVVKRVYLLTVAVSEGEIDTSDDGHNEDTMLMEDLTKTTATYIFDYYKESNSNYNGLRVEEVQALFRRIKFSGAENATFTVLIDNNENTNGDHVGWHDEPFSGSEKLTYQDGRYYMYVSDPVRWSTAYDLSKRHAIGRRMGYLMTLTSTEELEILRKVAQGDCWTAGTRLRYHRDDHYPIERIDNCGQINLFTLGNVPDLNDYYNYYHGTYLKDWGPRLDLETVMSEMYWACGPESNQVWSSGSIAEELIDTVQLDAYGVGGQKNELNKRESCAVINVAENGKLRDEYETDTYPYVIEFGYLTEVDNGRYGGRRENLCTTVTRTVGTIHTIQESANARLDGSYATLEEGLIAAQAGDRVDITFPTVTAVSGFALEEGITLGDFAQKGKAATWTVGEDGATLSVDRERNVTLDSGTLLVSGDSGSNAVTVEGWTLTSAGSFTATTLGGAQVTIPAGSTVTAEKEGRTCTFPGGMTILLGDLEGKRVLTFPSLQGSGYTLAEESGSTFQLVTEQERMDSVTLVIPAGYTLRENDRRTWNNKDASGTGISATLTGNKLVISGTPKADVTLTSWPTLAQSGGSRTYVDITTGEAFLGGDYIELGLRPNGTFGTSGNVPATGSVLFHPGSDDDQTLGLRINGGQTWAAGTVESDQATGDYAADEGWSLAWKNSPEDDPTLRGTVKSSDSSNGSGVTTGSKVTVETFPDGADTVTAATTTATVGETVAVEQRVQFTSDGKGFVTSVTLTNEGTEPLSGLSYLRTLDPAQKGAESDNYFYQDESGNVWVMAFGGNALGADSTLTAVEPEELLTANAQAPFVLSAKVGEGYTVRAVTTDRGWSTYDDFRTEDLYGKHAYSDTEIGLEFLVDTLAAGESITFSWVSSLDCDIDSAMDNAQAELDAAPPTVAALTMAVSEEKDAQGGEKLVEISTTVKDTVGEVNTLYYNYTDGEGSTSSKKKLSSITATGREQTLSGTIDLSDLPRGEYSFQFWVSNTRGNSSAKGSKSVTVTETGLSVSGGAGGNGSNGSGSNGSTGSNGSNSSSGSAGSGGSSGSLVSSANGAVSVGKTDHGGVAITPEKPEAGATVTVVLTPEVGYELKTLTVTDRKGNVLPLTKNADGSYSFTQPTGPVSIQASFQPKGSVGACRRDESCPIAAFPDGNVTAWYHDGLHFCLEEGLLQGGTNGMLAPEGTVTRAQAVAFLWRLANSPTVEGESPFADMKPDAWYAPAIRWAVSEGIIQGYGDGNFGGADEMTREQLVTMLYRYAKLQGNDLPSGELEGFADADQVHAFARPALKWATAAGIMNGIPQADGTRHLAPTGTVSRGELAVMGVGVLES